MPSGMAVAPTHDVFGPLPARPPLYVPATVAPGSVAADVEAEPQAGGPFPEPFPGGMAPELPVPAPAAPAATLDAVATDAMPDLPADAVAMW